MWRLGFVCCEVQGKVGPPGNGSGDKFNPTVKGV
jgi:hypothetical protein